MIMNPISANLRYNGCLKENIAEARDNASFARLITLAYLNTSAAIPMDISKTVITCAVTIPALFMRTFRNKI